MKVRYLCAAMVLASVAIPTTVQADLAADLAAETRSAEDQARDAGRKPAEVLAWLGIGPGMTVMDLVASGGCIPSPTSALRPDARRQELR